MNPDTSIARRRGVSEAFAAFCPAAEQEGLRQRFIEDLSLTPATIATETKAPLFLVVEMIVSDKWQEERRKFHKISAEAELLRYQALVQGNRLPTVSRQLGLLDSLHRMIETVMAEQQATYEELDQARQQGASSEVILALVKRLPSSRSLNELATAVEKASNTAGRLLNIRENLFDEAPKGPGGGGNNLFILPGAQPLRPCSPDTAINVTPL